MLPAQGAACGPHLQELMRTRKSRSVDASEALDQSSDLDPLENASSLDLDRNAVRFHAAPQIGVISCSDPPSCHRGLHGFRDRALERRILVGLLGHQRGRVRPVLAHLRHGRPAMGRNNGLQPSAVHRIDGTEHPPLALGVGGQREVPHRLIGIPHPQKLTAQLGVSGRPTAGSQRREEDRNH